MCCIASEIAGRGGAQHEGW
jgi:hypothetical protein